MKMLNHCACVYVLFMDSFSFSYFFLRTGCIMKTPNTIWTYVREKEKLFFTNTSYLPMDFIKVNVKNLFWIYISKYRIGTDGIKFQ